jgi:threonine dehydrogenase-like Zn-dependent dehydrogenase
MAVEQVAPKTNPDGDYWQPGNAPSQVLDWAVESLAKAGTLSVVGVYPASMKSFRIGDAMEKNLTIRMGNCNHRKYIPALVRLVQQGTIEPKKILAQVEPLMSAIDAYKVFDLRQPGWIKVELQPQKALSHGA